MTPETLDHKPRRGWQRGLMLSGLALALAWTFRAADRRQRPAPAPAGSPLPAAGALPADTSLGAPAGAMPRLLVIPAPSADGAPPPGWLADLERASVGRLALRTGDAGVARALGLKTLPAFVVYDANGRERRRLSGPEALAELRTELQALGLVVPALEPVTPP